MVVGFLMPAHSIWDDQIARIKSEYPAHRFFEALSPDSPQFEELDILIASRFSAEDLEKARRLKCIFQPLTGINHLPVEALRSRGVRVFNVHSNAKDVAEHALAMTLAFYGRIIEYHCDLSRGKWHGMWVKGGKEDNLDSIFGKTCLILGTGAIGSELANLFKAFSCTVHGWRKNKALAAPEGFDDIVTDLKEAIAVSEIVAVALPATPLTDGLLSKDILMSMAGKFLINVGRGSIVDEEGLYLALEKGILKGAAIDTWYNYPQGGKYGFPSRFPLHEARNIVLSPHVAGSTNQAVARSVSDTLTNLRKFLDSGWSENEVDLSARY